MLVNCLKIIVGLALLLFGSEALVRGSCWLAQKLKISPAVIGLTIVAAGTSMPELMVSLKAAIIGSYGLSLGNVVGSNLFNIAAILGITALVRPLSCNKESLNRDWPVMMAATILLGIFALNFSLGRLECLIFIIIYLLYTIYIIKQSRDAMSNENTSGEDLATASFGQKGWREILLNSTAIILGVITLALGARILVMGAENLARDCGVSETVIGLTIVAAGTSMPELITSLVAALRGRDDIAIGNIIGSNIFNILGILGLTGLIHPLAVPGDILYRDMAWLVAISLLLFPFMKSKNRLSRPEGLIMVGAFIIYTILLIINAKSESLS